MFSPLSVTPVWGPKGNQHLHSDVVRQGFFPGFATYSTRFQFLWLFGFWLLLQATGWNFPLSHPPSITNDGGGWPTLFDGINELSIKLLTALPREHPNSTLLSSSRLVLLWVQEEDDIMSEEFQTSRRCKGTTGVCDTMAIIAINDIITEGQPSEPRGFGSAQNNHGETREGAMATSSSASSGNTVSSSVLKRQHHLVFVLPCPGWTCSGTACTPGWRRDPHRRLWSAPPAPRGHVGYSSPCTGCGKAPAINRNTPSSSPITFKNK